jgi:hypothetical protein
MDYINDLKRLAGITESDEDIKYVVEEWPAAGGRPHTSTGYLYEILEQLNDDFHRHEKSLRTTSGGTISKVIIYPVGFDEYDQQ